MVTFIDRVIVLLMEGQALVQYSLPHGSDQSLHHLISFFHLEFDLIEQVTAYIIFCHFLAQE